MGLFDMVGNLITGALDYERQGESLQDQRVIEGQNYNLQVANYEYMKALNQEIMNRADTAHQREVKDLREAGLNPLISTGGNEIGGSVMPTEAPQINYNATANTLTDKFKSAFTNFDNIVTELQNIQLNTQSIKSAKAKAKTDEINAEIDKITAIDKIKQSKLSTKEKETLYNELLTDEEYKTFFGITKSMTPYERLGAIELQGKKPTENLGATKYTKWNKEKQEYENFEPYKDFWHTIKDTNNQSQIEWKENKPTNEYTWQNYAEGIVSKEFKNFLKSLIPF